MRTIEVRRHAERADSTDEASVLTERGRQMCEVLASRAQPYALVVSSPKTRALETARLIAGRLDRVEPGLLPELHGLPFGFWEELHDLAGYRDLMASQAGARRIAEGQMALWASLVAEVEDGASVLAVSHGAVVELGGLLAAERLGRLLDGPTFGLCEGVTVNYEGVVPMAVEIVRA